MYIGIQTNIHTKPKEHTEKHFHSHIHTYIAQIYTRKHTQIDIDNHSPETPLSRMHAHTQAPKISHSDTHT